MLRRLAAVLLALAFASGGGSAAITRQAEARYVAPSPLGPGGFPQCDRSPSVGGACFQILPDERSIDVLVRDATRGSMSVLVTFHSPDPWALPPSFTYCSDPQTWAHMVFPADVDAVYVTLEAGNGCGPWPATYGTIDVAFRDNATR